MWFHSVRQIAGHFFCMRGFPYPFGSDSFFNCLVSFRLYIELKEKPKDTFVEPPAVYINKSKGIKSFH